MNYKPPTWEIVDAGVDWLTLTAKEHPQRQELLYRAQLLASVQERIGAQQKAWRQQGYDGWKSGNVIYGEREDSAIVKLSGRTDMADVARFHASGIHCTRIDVQVTARCSLNWNGYAKGAIQQCEWDRELLKGTSDDKNWPKLKLMDGRGDGDTLSVGSRSSERFGRLYDKQRESGEEQWLHCWRWECEYKGEMAPRVMQRVAELHKAGYGITELVAGQYVEWGFKLPWPFGPSIIVDGPGRIESDAERKMRWIRTQAAPTIRWLLENGHVDSIEDLVYNVGV